MSALREIPRTSGARLFAEYCGVSLSLRLRRAAARKQPIIAGPWHSEIGFELLYWIPMLRWALELHGIGPERVTAVSRGGVESWYGGIASTYVDLLDSTTPDQLRQIQDRRIAELGGQKQYGMIEPDRQLLAAAAGDRLDDAMVLHPSQMYRLFRGFWSRRCPLSLVEDRTVNRPIAGTGGTFDELPRRYLAVKAYYSACFPETDENTAWLAEVFAELTRSIDIVVLDTGLAIDDHSDADSGMRTERIHSARALMNPRDNLAVQTEIIAASLGLAGTYGGFSYLAPYLGVPATGFYSDDNFNHGHLAVMDSAVGELTEHGGGAPFRAVDIARTSAAAAAREMLAGVGLD